MPQDSGSGFGSATQMDGVPCRATPGQRNRYPNLEQPYRSQPATVKSPVQPASPTDSHQTTCEVHKWY
jgi:hypothetical protein